MRELLLEYPMGTNLVRKGRVEVGRTRMLSNKTLELILSLRLDLNSEKARALPNGVLQSKAFRTAGTPSLVSNLEAFLRIPSGRVGRCRAAQEGNRTSAGSGQFAVPQQTTTASCSRLMQGPFATQS
jgi:hypothetical protein